MTFYMLTVRHVYITCDTAYVVKYNMFYNRVINIQTLNISLSVLSREAIQTCVPLHVRCMLLEKQNDCLPKISVTVIHVKHLFSSYAI